MKKILAGVVLGLGLSALYASRRAKSSEVRTKPLERCVVTSLLFTNVLRASGKLTKATISSAINLRKLFTMTESSERDNLISSVISEYDKASEELVLSVAFFYKERPQTAFEALRLNRVIRKQLKKAS